MKIAIHVDISGRPVSLYEDGVIHLYQGTGESWSKTGEFAFALPQSLSIARLRALVEETAAGLKDCRTLISGDRNGYVYALLGEMGFSCWTSEGSIEEQLLLVERKSQELAASACVSSACASGGCGGGRKPLSCGPDVAAPPPENLGGGKLRVDVAAVMRTIPGLNSRQILLPVIEGGGFSELEVICDHLPRWFEGKIDELGLAAVYETLPGVGVIATLTRPTA